MSQPNITDLNWPQRLQIIAALNVDLDSAASVFNVSKQDIDQARHQYKADATFNAAGYASQFSATQSTATTHVVKKGKKRGRQTTKIADALAAVTTEKISLDDFCAQHGVSQHCVRQHSRFAPGRKDIMVRKDKASGKVMVWSEPDTAD